MAGLRTRQQSDMEKALEERKKKQTIRDMQTTAQEAKNDADRQREKHYKAMMECVQKKDYKRAERHAKMYAFMDKLSKVTQEYQDMLEDQMAMAKTLQTLEKINKSFGTVFGSLGNTEDITTKTVKNMKKFSSYIQGMDDQLDRMMGAMDDMLSGGKKRGRRAKNAPPEENDQTSFLKYLGSNTELSTRYNGDMGASAAPAAPAAPVTKPAGPAPAPAAPAGPKDDGSDGFISVGRPD